MSRLFDDFFGDIGHPRFTEEVQGAAWAPRIDAIETEKELVVSAELPVSIYLSFYHPFEKIIFFFDSNACNF